MAIFRSGQSGLLMPGVVRPTLPSDIVLSDNRLVRYWPLDADALKSSTVTADFTGTSDGTVNGTVAFSIAGQIGGCYSFPGGATSFIDTTVNAGITRSTPFSITAWVQATSNSFTLVSTFVDSGVFDGAALFWGNGSNNNKTIGYLTGQTTTIQSVANNAKTLNIWYHLAVTYDGSSANTGIQLYENGEMLTAVTRSGGPLTDNPTDRPWRIGNDRSPSDSGFIGLIDDVRVYDRALDPSEIRQLYFAGLQGSRDQAPLGLEYYGGPDDVAMPALVPGWPTPIMVTLRYSAI